MSRTYRDRPRRLVKEDARRAGFVTHLRPYGPLPCDALLKEYPLDRYPPEEDE